MSPRTDNKVWIRKWLYEICHRNPWYVYKKLTFSNVWKCMLFFFSNCKKAEISKVNASDFKYNFEERFLDWSISFLPIQSSLLLITDRYSTISLQMSLLFYQHLAISLSPRHQRIINVSSTYNLLVSSLIVLFQKFLGEL